jgi:hypothetical protein
MLGLIVAWENHRFEPFKNLYRTIECRRNPLSARNSASMHCYASKLRAANGNRKLVSYFAL